MGTNVYLPNSISWPTSTEVEHKNLFKVGGKHEAWHKDAFRREEVKLIRSHAKIYVKTISGVVFAFVMNKMSNFCISNS